MNNQRIMLRTNDQVSLTCTFLLDKFDLFVCTTQIGKSFLDK